MNKSIVETALNSKEFTELINGAAPLKVRIKTDLASDMRTNCDDFLNEVAKADAKINVIWNKKRKDRTDGERETLKTWMKVQKRKFKTITKILAPKPNTDPLKNLIDKITEIAQYAKYIGNTDLQDRLAHFGVSLNIKDLEEEHPYFKDDDVKEIVKDIFSQSKSTQEVINDTNEQIKSKIFEEIDDTLKYSKSNLSGIKSSQFSKLVNTKAVSIMKTEDQYTKFKDNMIRKDAADIESREIVLEKSRTI